MKEGKAASLMCAYDAWDGVPSCANKEVMTDLARDTWNFTGKKVAQACCWLGLVLLLSAAVGCYCCSSVGGL